jgi:hypothetical protein
MLKNVKAPLSTTSLMRSTARTALTMAEMTQLKTAFTLTRTVEATRALKIAALQRRPMLSQPLIRTTKLI